MATRPVPRPRPVRRWLAAAGLLLAAVVLLATAGGYLFARRSLPVVEGELVLPGLRAPVYVYRDARGIPHIEAENEHDLYMAQGYVTAQDRLFQMDLSRRAASGRLAEIAGEAALEMDKLFRTLMLRRSAEESVNAYEPWVRELLDAYAAGVNAFIETGRLPVEFALLGYAPEPWTAVDSASIGKYMADYLSRSFEEELFDYELRQKVGAELADQVLPVYPEGAPTVMRSGGHSVTSRVTAPDVTHLPRVILDGFPTLSGRDPDAGSNNWVVSGQWTASGKPLLANDPHLRVSTPSIWYEVHLVVPGEINAFGVIFPGAPGIIIGQNEHIAWGVTNTGPDVQDVYVEQRHPDDPYRFLFKGEYEPAQVFREQIRVKSKPPVEHEVVVTRHGPIVSEVQGAPENHPPEALAVQWTGHLATGELETVLRLPRATNWAEFREALRTFHVPTQNFVFASVDGTIAYRASGLVPIRRGDDGRFVKPGWTGEYEWEGYIPFEEMPEVVNPPTGYIVTANNKVIDDGYPYHLSYHWAQPYRAMRIIEVLEGKKGLLTVEDMQALQVDYANLQARTLLPVLLPPVAEASLNDLEQRALALLQDWDHVDRAADGAPLLFQLWLRELRRQLFEPVMGAELFQRMPAPGNVTDVALLEAASGRPNDWIVRAGGLEALAVSSFRAAVQESAALQGDDPGRWSWGQFHQFAPRHELTAAVRLLGYVFNPTFRPIGGSGTTVGAMGFGPDGSVRTSAPWRQVVDLADPTGNSWSVLTPGQAGHFLSPWYEDQAAAHAAGKLYRRQFEGYREDGKLLVLRPN